MARDELVSEVCGKIDSINGGVDLFLDDMAIRRFRRPLNLDFLLYGSEAVIQSVELYLKQLVIRNLDDVAELTLLQEHIFVCRDNDLVIVDASSKLTWIRQEECLLRVLDFDDSYFVRPNQFSLDDFDDRLFHCRPLVHLDPDKNRSQLGVCDGTWDKLNSSLIHLLQKLIKISDDSVVEQSNTIVLVKARMSMVIRQSSES